MGNLVSIGTWLGIGGGYALALMLVAGGGYLAIFMAGRPLRFLGLVFIIIGTTIAAFNFGQQRGAENCEAAWKAKNYEAQIARLRQEAGAKQIAATVAADQAQQLASEKDALQQKINDYEMAAANSASCRRATDDDDRRLCNITGGAGFACSNSR